MGLFDAFRALARARGARAFHPCGVWFEGTVTGLPEGGFPLLADATPVTGRMSKGVGTAGALPDVLGLAVRVPRGEGFDGPWDLALSSSGGNRVTRALPLPARHWAAPRYGSIMPYWWRGRLRWLSAVAEPDAPVVAGSLRDLVDLLRTRPLAFTLSASSAGTGWRDIARLSVHRAIAPPEGISFDPVLNTPPGLDVAPAFLSRLRESAYEGSRRGRNANR
ncbi:hypothetical protein AB0I60_30070 [Actinosynnema sp. NPDC050436]|uniref:hypothetical protein n=1 Tax=Actinosynnema sp. NPDC050436 TaxID=3155659 RepID=UPI0033E66409